jgi:hypothetical protein
MAERMNGLRLDQIRTEASSCLLAGVFTKEIPELVQIELSPNFTAMHACVCRLPNGASKHTTEKSLPSGALKPVGHKKGTIRGFATVITASDDTGIVAEWAQSGRVHGKELRRSAAAVNLEGQPNE